jgi:1-aminocyclopropane-1-carboxylate deaminase/D-cysteine desulfhydrase-like pyridoxal-dependent ACC family enzyme
MIIMKNQKLKLWHKTFCSIPTPLQRLNPIKGINISVKRDDLNHLVIQGNKLRKLKYNIKYAIENNCKCVATFGGAYSNHLLATAQAAQIFGYTSFGFVRGDELEKQPQKWSQTLIQAQAFGMKLIFLSRHEYRLKEDSEIVKKHLNMQTSVHYVIPEGGSNALAVQGVKELIGELNLQKFSPTHIICACGTGGTLAGLIEGVAAHKMKAQIIGIPVLKGAEFLTQDIVDLSPNHAQVQWQLNHNYHAGGYAKSNQKTLEFAHNFSLLNKIALDKIYTAKSFYATYDLILNGEITSESSVLIIHTGGLQGGLNQV